MKTIWKYDLPIEDHGIIEMPIGAEILCAKSQGEKVVIYALVETAIKSIEERNFLIVGAGHKRLSINENNYIGTVMLLNGGLVFHIFEYVND